VRPLIVVVGETASGKSSLAMDIAQRYHGEILSADAMTVYKGFDIGTAKPSKEDQQIIPHHLIDIAEASDGFSVSAFQRAAYGVIKDIQGRGKLPILVGGSGLYIDSVLYDFSFAEQPSDALRAELNALSLEELHTIAREGGFDLGSIDAQNKRRVIRLIENSGKVATRGDLREATLVLGVSRQRHELLERVEQRVKAMIDAGLEQEVRELTDTYSWEVEPMRSVGYREWQAYFEHTVDIEHLKQQIVIDTMKLAKKQRTWFKRNKSIQWITSSGHEDSIDVIVTSFLNKYPL
jgi:tRNA dimethylallyltransferase